MPNGGFLVRLCVHTMTIKQFLTIIGFATFVCWATWGVVLWNIDPYEASLLHMSFFYVSLFLALTGTVATALYAGYHFFGDVQVPVFRYVKKSMKQGVLIASLLVGLLFLQGIQAFNMWTLVLIGLLIAFIASLNLSHKTPKNI